MLQILSIQNIALIEKLELAFSNGFHVLTGETGAGKSIVIDAVNFVLGERASRELIKSGAQKAAVQAMLSIAGNDALKHKLEELGLTPDEEDELVLSRELSAAGKSVCRINGVLVNLSVLKSVSDLLVDIHGQHEHQSLLHPETHIGYLDAFNEDTIAPLKLRTMDLYKRMQVIRRELTGGFPSENERLRRMDILAYQIDEIEAAKLVDGEEEQLEAELQVQSNAQQILSTLETSYAMLFDEDAGALLRADEARRQLEGIQSLHENYEDACTRLTDAYYALEDVSYTLRDLKSDFEFQPDRLEDIEDRLSVIRTLEKKYGGSISEVLGFYQSACEEMDALMQSDARREQLAKKLGACEAEYASAAEELTRAREKNARALEKALTAQLKDLGMNNACFEVALGKLAGPSPNGMDTAEFLLSTNAGEPVKPLSKVASGGELSRIMLAFKTVHIGAIQTIIFDEIDTGISGHTATIVGRKMLQIARTRQVICVTHLPQIAAMADIHYLVQKTQTKKSTASTVTRLDEDGRVHELAHMMGATDENTRALEHARELLQQSRHEA